MFAVIGFLDDYAKLKKNKGISAKKKLLYQIFAAGIISITMFSFIETQAEQQLIIPFFKDAVFNLGVFFIPLTMLVIISSSNAVNLTDGLDGLAIMPIVLVSGGFGIFAYLSGNINFSEYLLIPYINNAGSVFCGKYSPESFGDYASGSNHTLPTNRYAKTYSGLSVKDFGKIITFQTASPEGFLNLAPTVSILANAESLDAHEKAVSIRKNLASSEISLKSRKSFIKRSTNETNIYINLDIDGKGNFNIDTGLKYFDHMLEQLAKHGNFDLSVHSIGDLEIDEHHTIEDVSIALGEAFKNAIGKRENIERYASSENLVMDETISNVSIDMASRPFLKMKTSKLREYVGDFPTEMFEHFFISFINTLGFTCHIETKGTNSHHIIEATFKSFTRALSNALKKNDSAVASTKGTL